MNKKVIAPSLSSYILVLLVLYDIILELSRSQNTKLVKLDSFGLEHAYPLNKTIIRGLSQKKREHFRYFVNYTSPNFIIFCQLSINDILVILTKMIRVVILWNRRVVDRQLRRYT